MLEYRLIGAKEVTARLGVSRGTAYKIICDLNAGIEVGGKRVILGKVDERKFMLAYFADTPTEDESDKRCKEDNGTWSAQAWHRGTRGHHAVKRGFKAGQAAVEWENSFSNAQGANMSMKFSQFLELYKEDMQPRLRETTWCSKECMITGKILTYFGEMSMNEIASIDVIRWQNDLMPQKSSKGKCYSNIYP